MTPVPIYIKDKMKIKKSKLSHDHRIILAWMKEQELTVAFKGRLLYVALPNDCLVEVEDDFPNMTASETLEYVLKFCIDFKNQYLK